MAIVSIKYVLVQPTDENFVYTCHIQSKDNNGDDLKTYIYKQTNTLPQVLSKEQKNIIKFSLAMISIKHYVPNRDNNGDNLKTYIYKLTTPPP